MFIKGVGMTKFDYSQKPWWKFAYEAAMEALENAGMKISDIDAIVFSAISSAAGGEHQTHKAALLSDLFKTNVPIIENAAVCGGGGVAFWIANHLSGPENILVLAGERVVDNRGEVVTDYILSAAERVIEQTEGMLFPAQNALLWQQYMLRHPQASMDDLALISLKNHQNAVLNPKAYYYKRPVSLDDIKKSAVVASPLRLFDCSLSVNGGAAAIISRGKSDIEVAGSAFATDYLLNFGRDDVTSFKAARLASEKAYKDSGVGPENIQAAEVHDAFTSVELISYEDLGFCRPGGGPELIRSGSLNMGGKLPVNPSGGLKAKGHPISVTGLAQVYEITSQLRGNCGDRQIKPFPKVGLCHNIGGAGGSVTVHILKKT